MTIEKPKAPVKAAEQSVDALEQNGRPKPGDDRPCCGRSFLRYWYYIPFLGLWIAFFAAGLLIDTAPYREIVASKWEWSTMSFLQKITTWFVIVICYTPTNIAILCCLAGLLGTAGDQVKLGPDSGKHTPKDNTHPLLSGLIRGFCIYLVVISGTLLLTPLPFTAPTLDTYIRLAGLVSLLGFVASYDPGLFATGLKKLIGASEAKAGSSDGSGKEGSARNTATQAASGSAGTASKS